MASEKDLELVDHYVSNRMEAHEKAAFEKRLETDAELRNEVSLQHKVVESIRKMRVAELKTLLNDIPVSSIPTEGTSIAAKIGIWIAATALVGTGIYLYINQNNHKETQPLQKEERNETPAVAEPEKIEKPAQDVDVKPAQDDSNKQNKTVETHKPSTSAEKKTQEEPVAPSAIDVFDPTDESPKDGEPEAERSKSGEATAPSILVETIADKKYTFHYQFKDNKLYLYGSFEKNLYEIMEFFSDNKRTMFLFYKDNYYLLNEEDQKVKALAPIKDPELLEKLRDYRKNWYMGEPRRDGAFFCNIITSG